MNEKEKYERELVIKIAKEYLRTPYHHYGTVKGAGVDCLTLIIGIFKEAGLLRDVIVPKYSHEWHLHHSEEKYLNGLLKYSQEVEKPQPGDIALWKFGRCYSHGAIVIEWPIIIHAYIGKGCVLEDVQTATWLNKIGESSPDKGKKRPLKFFSYWK